MKKLMLIIPFLLLVSCATQQYANYGVSREEQIRLKFKEKAEFLISLAIDENKQLIIERSPELKNNYDEYIRECLILYSHANFERVNQYCSKKCTTAGFERLLRLDHNNELRKAINKEYGLAMNATEENRRQEAEYARVVEAERSQRIGSAFQQIQQGFNYRPPKQTNCTTRESFGTLYTNCQ